MLKNSNSKIKKASLITSRGNKHSTLPNNVNPVTTPLTKSAILSLNSSKSHNNSTSTTNNTGSKHTWPNNGTNKGAILDNQNKLAGVVGVTLFTTTNTTSNNHHLHPQILQNHHQSSPSGVYQWNNSDLEISCTPSNNTEGVGSTSDIAAAAFMWKCETNGHGRTKRVRETRHAKKKL